MQLIETETARLLWGRNETLQYDDTYISDFDALRRIWSKQVMGLWTGPRLRVLCNGLTRVITVTEAILLRADFLIRIMIEFSGDNVSRDSVTMTITRLRVLSWALAKGGWLGFDSRHKQKLLPFDTISRLASYPAVANISPGYFDSSLTITFSPPSRTKLKNASNITSTPLRTSHLTRDDNLSDVTPVLALNYQITENWSAVRNHLSFSKNPPPHHTSVRNHCYWKFFVERFKLGSKKKKKIERKKEKNKRRRQVFSLCSHQSTYMRQWHTVCRRTLCYITHIE